MNHLDLAFMLVFTALASTAFTAGVIMLCIAKSLTAETLRAMEVNKGALDAAAEELTGRTVDHEGNRA